MRHDRLISIIFVLLFAFGLFAQTDVTTSRISGVVKESNGGALPGVTVEAKNTETGFTASAQSDNGGAYRLINLPTGKYAISASLSGFNTVSRALMIEIGQAPTVNFTLALSTVSEAITVTRSSGHSPSGTSVPFGSRLTTPISLAAVTG